MKMKFTYLMAAIAAVVAVSSCTKSFVDESGGTDVKGVERVITASFGPAAKSYLHTDKFTPKFSDGDLILISNGSAKESCRIYVKDGNAVFYTRMTGTLKAVYPVSAAVTSGNDITGIKVLSVQTGLFKDANIAMAENITTEAVFENKTSILTFYVDEKIGVKHITVTGTSPVASNSETTITVDSDEALISSKTSEHLDPRLCYVSILPGTNTLTFSSATTTQGTVEKHTAATTFVINTIYKAFIPYYIEIKVGDTPEVYQRWSYCNLGAFLPEDIGLFFSWAATTGYKYTGDPKPNEFEGGHRFSPENSEYYDSSKYYGYSKYDSSSGGDGKTLLEPLDDAATAILGEGWRMPTAGSASKSGEFYSLISATYCGFSDIMGKRGIYVFDISDAPGKTAGTSGSLDGLDVSKAKLFFPNTGTTDQYYQPEYKHYKDSDSGYYWSSSLGATPSNARYLKFDSPSVGTNHEDSRYHAMPIRPIAVSPIGVYFDSLIDSEIL